MTKLTPTGLRSLIKKPGRHADGHGLYFRAVGDAKAYWVYRYRIAGHEREMSLGPYPELTLAGARAKHAAMRAQVLNKVDPLAGKHAKAKSGRPELAPSGVPTFGQMALDYVETHEADWRSAKHRAQWRMTLTRYCQPIWSTPVNEVDTAAVLSVLKPLWVRAPETGSRLRGRIETVLAAAQVDGHIPEDRPSPARWTNWLEHKLPKLQKLANGHHAALDYSDLPAFMAKLAEIDNVPAKALRFVILTAARSGEALGARWDEIDEATAIWTVPAERMKANKLHRVPLSAPALAILREMRELRRGDHPFVFPGQRPRKGLSHMVLISVLRRIGVEATTHGMRSAFRDWAGDKTNFQREVMEAALAHTLGNEAEQAYRRSDALEKRRELMELWANYVTGSDADNVVMMPLRRGMSQ